jgi:hypothetical protein
MVIRPREYRRKSVLLVLFLAAVSQACSRPDAFRRTDAGSTPSSGQKLPFHASSDHSADEAERPDVPADWKPVDKTPFRTAPHLHGLPAGTLVTVQLEHPFSLAKVHAGDSFSASLAAPLTVDGDLVIERGAPVVGLVESTQLATNGPGLAVNASLIRLTLNSIAVDGRPVTLQTASLFARTSNLASHPTSGGAQLQKGHQLTFRLTAPMTLADLNSLANRGDADPSKQP